MLQSLMCMDDCAPAHRPGSDLGIPDNQGEIWMLRMLFVLQFTLSLTGKPREVTYAKLGRTMIRDCSIFFYTDKSNIYNVIFWIVIPKKFAVNVS